MIKIYAIALNDEMAYDIVVRYINNALRNVMTKTLDMYIKEYRKSYASVYDPDFQEYIEDLFPVNYAKGRAADQFFNLYCCLMDENTWEIDELVQKYLLAKMIGILVREYKKKKTYLPEKDREYVYKAAGKYVCLLGKETGEPEFDSEEMFRATADEIMQEIENPEHYYKSCLEEYDYALLDEWTEAELIEEGYEGVLGLGLLRADNSYIKR